ncbi:MAG TPA: HAD family hydrolase [Flavitalea sp.]|nr:HAD family hydrolase [Flavitalea sp.]
MKKNAIIFDLDNTVYSVRSIGEDLFASLFEAVVEDGNHVDMLVNIKEDIMRKPFQLVAREYHFNEELTSRGIDLLSHLEYKGKIEPFADYELARNLPIDKFLVTTGFLKLQRSKVEGMKLGADFKEIHVIDPSISTLTKKEIFTDILERHRYPKAEVLVVGDDINSEIKAAQDLGIDAVLYDSLMFTGK